MDKNAVVIGMKVVPHGKTVGCQFDASNTWNTQGGKERGFVFVAMPMPGMGADVFALKAVGNWDNNASDNYRASDFEPYVEPAK